MDISPSGVLLPGLTVSSTVEVAALPKEAGMLEYNLYRYLFISALAK